VVIGDLERAQLAQGPGRPEASSRRKVRNIITAKRENVVIYFRILWGKVTSALDRVGN